jgi:tRNA(Ile)-lysidine synthase
MRSSLGHLGHVVKSFLQQNWNRRNPLLIGYSGGGDSKALLYAALESVHAPIHIAHVDHGWREESRDEALLLQEEARCLGVPFHTTRLEKKTSENEARQCRLAFFRSLQKQYSFQAVLLGHQADDLAETVLKRLFEGAHLPQLSSMRCIAQIDGLLIWRPLLFISKREITKWLVDRRLDRLEDSSNRDTRYLRARMREELLPFLNRSFGKNISENLAILSERARELDEYLTQRSSQFKKNLVNGPFGCWVDGEGLHSIELRHLLQLAAKQENILFSHRVLESILDWIKRQKANCQMIVQHRTIVVDRGHFFLLAKNLPRFDQPIHLLSNGRSRSGDWVAEETFPEGSQCSWQSLWRGEASIQCFDGEPTLRLPPCGARWPEKVPLFMRRICPALMHRDVLIGDFVTGKACGGRRSVKIYVDRVPSFDEKKEENDS